LARRLGATPERLADVERGRYDAFEPGWASALAFADAMTRTAQPPDAAAFRDLSGHWSPSQVVEIVAVIGLFNYFNRFAEALTIPPTV